ncbi:MAG: molecular chaperone TorD family protein [Actinomycetota bacterium]|nr:molecular chaperone TorD family protein [Actinomycetota bacterium]
MTNHRPLLHSAGRWELIRMLGAICDTPEVAVVAARYLDLGELKSSAHTQVFVMNAPPYAAIHLGGEGQLGGDAADRVGGFWRALGLVPPVQPDHLSALLALYAHLGEAGDDATKPDTRSALTRMRHALIWEHLWSWIPGYAQAITDLDVPILSPWAVVLREVLAAELDDGIGGLETVLPAALRDAPSPLSTSDNLSDLLDGLIAPIRCGIVITRQTLAKATGDVGVGHRIGERRFTLRAMLEQDTTATLRWLATETRRWHDLRIDPGSSLKLDGALAWWAERSAQVAGALAVLAKGSAPDRPEAFGSIRVDSGVGT